MRILIVEDSLSLITLYKNIIKTLRPKTKFEVVTVTNCDDYFKYYENYNFDLALVVWKLQSCNTSTIVKDIVNKTNLYIISGRSNVAEVTKIANKYGVPVKVKPITVSDIEFMLTEIETNVSNRTDLKWKALNI